MITGALFLFENDAGVAAGYAGGDTDPLPGFQAVGIGQREAWEPNAPPETVR